MTVGAQNNIYIYMYNTDIVRSADKKALRLYSYYTMP